MKPSADVERLAAQMSALRAEDPPRTLPVLVGDLCGKRTGVPTPVEMGRTAMRSLFQQTPEYAARLLPEGPDAPDDAVEAAFLNWLGSMTHLQRYRVLEPFYRRVPVPLFYQDLADLVVNGFVAHILTTNVDTLLEQALDALGLVAGHDYGVQVVGMPDPDPATTPPPATIIKLYGDLGQEQLPIGPGEIDRVLKNHRSFVKGELATDLIVVGHELDPNEPRAIDGWLARGEGEIWWVHPEWPEQDLIAPITANRPVTFVTGEEQGDPEAFFGQLNLHLIRLPAVEVLGPARTSPGDTLEHEYLKSRIEKAQATKYSVERNVLPGEENPALQAQIGYLAETVATYGNQLRELAARDPRELLTRLVDEAEKAEVEVGTVEFLAQQATIVERELASPSPNQLVVAGAMSAASSIAQGLASQLTPELADELRSTSASYSVTAS